ncbi:MAG: thrombospondin type 3 repeat-containing protein [Gammaproteobacteria bacterium]
MFAHSSTSFRFILTSFILAVMCVAQAGDMDSDSDGVTDPFDNCVLVANAAQTDTDDDGWGNRCDPDFDNNGVINFQDIATLAAAFLTPDPNLDLTGDGVVNFFDIVIIRDFFLATPGPAGYANWVNPGDGVWNEASNWFPAIIPPAEARATISQPGDITVTVPSMSGELAAAEVVLDETLLFTGGPNDRLTVSGRFLANGNIHLQSGTLDAGVLDMEGLLFIENGTLANATLQTSTPPLALNNVNFGTFDNVLLRNDLELSDQSQLRIRNGLTLDSVNLDLDSTTGFSYLNFEGSQTLGGTGDIRFTGTSLTDTTSRIRATGANNVLTIGPDITVRSVTTGGRIGENTSMLVLQGRVIADIEDRTVALLGDLLTLDGTVEASNGATLRVDRNWITSATNTITANASTLILDGNWQNFGTITATDSTVEFSSIDSENWSNLGAINLVNSPVDAGGTFFVSDFGTFNSDSFVSIVGILDNTGSTLNVNTATGMADLRIGNGGTILGGSIVGSGGLVVGPNISTATLDGVTLETDLMLLNATQLGVENGLTLSGGNILMNPTSSFCYLNLNGTQTLGGSGDIRFSADAANDSNIRLRNSVTGATVTIGSGVTVVSDTSGGRIGEISRDLILEASVISNVPGRVIALRGNVLNLEGDLTAVNGGEILIDGNWTNAAGSTIDVTDGQLALDGEWVNNGNISASNSMIEFGSSSFDSWQNLGTITLNGSPLVLNGSFLASDLGNLTSDSAISVTGELDNTGTTLNLDSVVGNPFSIGTNGTIIGGSVAGSVPLTVGPSVSGAVLMDVTMETDLVIRNSSQLSIMGTLTLDSVDVSLECSPSFSYLNFVNSAVLTGTGEVVFNGTTSSDSNCRARPVSSVAEATIGPNITVRSGLSGGQLGNISSTLNLQGEVISTLTEREIRIIGSPGNIMGPVTATDGGEINIDGTWSNMAGNVISATDSSLLLQGDWINNGNITALDSAVTFGGTTADTWNNAGTGIITLTGTPLSMDGTFSIANLGNYSSDSSLLITGTLDNAAATLDIDAINASDLVLGTTGIIDGGTITGSSTWPVGPSISATLRGVTLGLDMSLLQNTQLTVEDNLTLVDSSIELTASAGGFSYLNVSSNQTIGGTGSIVFAGSSNSDTANRVRRVGTGLTTFEAGINFETSATGGRIGDTNRETTILGDILSNVPGRAVFVIGNLLTLSGDTSAVNDGELIIDGDWQLATEANIDVNSGDIRLLGNWQNFGSINATDTSIRFGDNESDSWDNEGSITLINSPLILDGSFVADNLGSLTSDAALTVFGAINLAGEALDLNSLGGSSIDIANGARFVGGILTGSAVSVGPSVSFTLDGITLNTNLNLLNASQATVQNNLVLDNANVSLQSNGSTTSLTLSGTQSVSGIGEILYGGTTSGNSSNRINTGGSGTILTIENGITIRTDTANGTMGSSGATIVMNGDIVNRRTDGNVDVFGLNFELTGTVSLGETALLDVDTTNVMLLPAATLDIDIGSSGNGLFEAQNAVTLGGTANFNLAGGFTPTSCQPFTFISYSGFFGGFSGVTGTGGGEAFTLNEQALETSGVAPGVGC